ncbi:MAG TPA: hypothetical protein VIJ93_08835, partial [bacterium]
MFITILAAIPLILSRLSPAGTAHIQSQLNLSNFKPLFQYLAEIFWNGTIGFPFGSNWGGLLNPILDSLVFLGILRLIQIADRFLISCAALCLFLPILPGALTNNVEIHRIFPLIPFLMVAALLGAKSLLISGSRPVIWGIATTLLLGSFTLDSYNFIFRYSDIRFSPPQQQWRTVWCYQAYQVLREKSRQTGPLYLFSEFNTDYADKTLNVACYPFDALQNPSLSKDRLSFAAFILN